MRWGQRWVPREFLTRARKTPRILHSPLAFPSLEYLDHLLRPISRHMTRVGANLGHPTFISPSLFQSSLLPLLHCLLPSIFPRKLVPNKVHHKFSLDPSSLRTLLKFCNIRSQRKIGRNTFSVSCLCLRYNSNPLFSTMSATWDIQTSWAVLAFE